MLSVIIPAYNRAELLTRALTSLSAQACRDFEVIVCDDGSVEPLKPVADRFRATYIRIENSGGPARPRNRAIAASQGGWLAFLDSDDWWTPEKVGVTLQAIRNNPECEVFYHRLRIEGGGRRRRWWRRATTGSPVNGEPLAHLLTRGNCIPNSSVVISRKAYDRTGLIDEGRDIAAIEDFDYWLRLAESGSRFHFINRVLGVCWHGSDGISADPIGYTKKVRLAFERHTPKLEPRYAAASRAQLNYELAHLYMLGGRASEARKLLRDARGLSGRTLARYWKLTVA